MFCQERSPPGMTEWLRARLLANALSAPARALSSRSTVVGRSVIGLRPIAGHRSLRYDQGVSAGVRGLMSAAKKQTPDRSGVSLVYSIGLWNAQSRLSRFSSAGVRSSTESENGVRSPDRSTRAFTTIQPPINRKRNQATWSISCSENIPSLSGSPDIDFSPDSKHTRR
jgi:hypothetical protein